MVDVGDKVTRFRGPGEVKIGKECCILKAFKFLLVDKPKEAINNKEILSNGT
jgi:hypothetical protein